MSISIDEHSAKEVREVRSVHLLPCHVEFDGSAKVDKYFLNCIHEKSEGGYTASFRGRPLDGKVTEVPEGYTGYVMEEPRRDYGDDEHRKFHVTHKFNEFTLWNLDKPPSDHDKFPNAMKWIDIASAIAGSYFFHSSSMNRSRPVKTQSS